VEKGGVGKKSGEKQKTHLSGLEGEGKSKSKKQGPSAKTILQKT